MGRDKGLLELAGQPMVLRVAEYLRPVTSEVVLVGAPERYGHLGLPVQADREAGKGPVAGIATALAASRFEWNLIVACDLPYLETRFLHLLLEEAVDGEWDAVVPRPGPADKGWQPLCAAYHRRALPAFERVLAGERLKISLAYDELRVRTITEKELAEFAFPERMFENINTPGDYEKAKRHFRTA